MSEEVNSFEPLIDAINNLGSIIQIGLNDISFEIDLTSKLIINAILDGASSIMESIALGASRGVDTDPIIDLVEEMDDAMVGLSEVIDDMMSGFKGTGKQSKKFFGGMKKGLGSMIKASWKMALISAVMEPVGAAIGAFLEPLQMLTPLFESWGQILGQLLVPIVKLLLDLLMPLTPAFIAIVEALMPLILLLVSIVGWLVPIIELLAAIIVAFVNIVAIVTNALSILTVLSEGIRVFADTFFGFFTELWTIFGNAVADIANGIKEFWDGIIEGITDATGNIFDIIEETWLGVTSIFRTKETGGIW